MGERIKFTTVPPQAYQAMWDLDRYVRGAIDQELLELIKIRASIINECAYCIDMHTRDAAKAGEDTRRLFALAAWRDAPFFSRSERATLALTDAATRLGPAGVPDDVWDEAQTVLGDKGVVDALLAIIVINAWNRLMIATRTPLPAADAVIRHVR